MLAAVPPLQARAFYLKYIGSIMSVIQAKALGDGLPDDQYRDRNLMQQAPYRTNSKKKNALEKQIQLSMSVLMASEDPSESGVPRARSTAARGVRVTTQGPFNTQPTLSHGAPWLGRLPLNCSH